ncbi:unnamed protein product, partial [Symbiodinium pilosum]
AVPVESARPAEPPAPGQHTALAASSWSTRGPPPGHRSPPPYSWFFVPLLHAAARSLHPDAIQQWEAHPFYGRLWADALANLQLAPAVPVATLATAVQTLQDVYAREGRQLSAFEAALPAVLAALVEGLPAGTLAHLNWVLPRVTDTNGYVPASAQEALLENYLGSGPATALTAALEESLRTSPESPLPAQVTPPSPRAVAGNAASPAPASPGDAQAPGTQSPAPPPARSAAGLQGRQLSAALATLDAVDATAVLRQPCPLFRSPPAFVKGPLRQALHFALTQLLNAASEPAGIDAQRAWKLWLLLPRMLLFRPSAAPRVPKPELRAPVANGRHGSMIQLRLPAFQPGGRSHALLAPPLAPADEATLQALQDPSRRPPQPYVPLDPDILAFSPDVPLALSREILISNLRRSRRGAAPGPSGYTAEILRPLLDDPAALEALHAVAELLARALLPTSAASALGLGRIVAVSKPAGGVRGIVVGDFLRAQHRTLLELLPTLPDLQVAWLLLLYCACPRAQYVLRILPPALTAAFAAEHDHRILSCLAQLLQVEASSDSPLPALVARR